MQFNPASDFFWGVMFAFLAIIYTTIELIGSLSTRYYHYSMSSSNRLFHGTQADVGVARENHPTN